MGTVGLAFSVCCACISVAMSSGCVRMLLFRSSRLFSGVFVVLLNMVWCILLGFSFSSARYLWIAFWIFFLVCSCIIFWASFFANFPLSASSLIHSLVGVVVFGGSGILDGRFFIRGCCCQSSVCVIIKIAFLHVW